MKPIKPELSPTTRLPEILHLNSRNSIVIGVAALSALTFSGEDKSGEVSAASEPEAIAATPPTAMAAKTQCEKEFSSGSICYWKVRKIYNLKRNHRHRYRTCTEVGKGNLKSHLTCSLSKSKSNTVKAEIGGTLKVGVGELSSKVGYDVSKTTTVTASFTTDVPKRTAAAIIWAPIYGSRKRVVQEWQECIQTSRGNYNRCFPARRPKRKHLRNAYTEKYKHHKFRAIIKK